MHTSTSSIRNYLRQHAGWIWNEQRQAFNHYLTLQEETLTEMLLLRMAKDHVKHGVRIQMFTKSEERRNGADWEWSVETRQCNIGFRVQAKRLYQKGEYGGHKPASGQTSKLIDMAGKQIPVYVFFNHEHGKNSDMFNAGGEPGYRGRSFWGCTIATAHAVKKAKSNKLADLIKYMKPWHHLVDTSGECSISKMRMMGSSGATLDRADGFPLPEWLELIKNKKDKKDMENYLKHKKLAGVAHFDFSDFRGE